MRLYKKLTDSLSVENECFFHGIIVIPSLAYLITLQWQDPCLTYLPAILLSVGLSCWFISLTVQTVEVFAVSSYLSKGRSLPIGSQLNASALPWAVVLLTCTQWWSCTKSRSVPTWPDKQQISLLWIEKCYQWLNVVKDEYEFPTALDSINDCWDVLLYLAVVQSCGSINPL